MITELLTVSAALGSSQQEIKPRHIPAVVFIDRTRFEAQKDSPNQ